MIDVIKQQFKNNMTPDQKLNIVREFLQILCLKAMNEKGGFSDLAFLGGTALRILFDLRRFSEDMDFSVVGNRSFDAEVAAKQLQKEFALYGLPFEAKVRAAHPVCGFDMKFSGLLKELGLSGLAAEKLSIKFEVDLRPPEGAVSADTLVNKSFLFSVRHYDVPSLFAGKLHACLFRKYDKGRDFYDLMWYLGRRSKPNYRLLNNAIRQSSVQAVEVNERNLKEVLLARVARVDFAGLKKDVERFLEDKNDLRLFDRTIFEDTIKLVY